jgi:hypothetical protein
VTDNSQIDAHEPGNLFQRLAVYPGLTPRNNG